VKGEQMQLGLFLTNKSAIERIRRYMPEHYGKQRAMYLLRQSKGYEPETRVKTYPKPRYEPSKAVSIKRRHDPKQFWNDQNSDPAPVVQITK
jgi:hypothetical protein